MTLGPCKWSFARALSALVLAAPLSACNLAFGSLDGSVTLPDAGEILADGGPSLDASSTDAAATDGTSAADGATSTDGAGSGDGGSAADTGSADGGAADAGSNDSGTVQVTLGAPVTMTIRQNTDGGVSIGADKSVSLSYPLDAVTGADLHNSAQGPSLGHMLGFAFGITAADPAWKGPSGAAGFVVVGGPQTNDDGRMSIFLVDPAPGGDAFAGDNEFGFTQHTTSDKVSGTPPLVFYQQYASNIPACQMNAPVVDVQSAPFNFQIGLVKTCLHVQVNADGDYVLSQRQMVNDRCAIDGPLLHGPATVKNCSLDAAHPCSRSQPNATCPTPLPININFYTGANTHNPGGAIGGTNGFIYSAVKKVAGALGVHAGSSLTGLYQIYRAN